MWRIAVSNMQQLTNSIRQSEISCQQQYNCFQSSSHCFLCVTQTQCTCCSLCHCRHTQHLLLSSFYSLWHRLSWPVQWLWWCLFGFHEPIPSRQCCTTSCLHIVCHCYWHSQFYPAVSLVWQKSCLSPGLDLVWVHKYCMVYMYFYCVVHLAMVYMQVIIH